MYFAISLQHEIVELIWTVSVRWPHPHGSMSTALPALVLFLACRFKCNIVLSKPPRRGRARRRASRTTSRARRRGLVVAWPFTLGAAMEA